MNDLGTIFPPRHSFDIAAYDTDEVVEGYRDHRLDDPEPGANRTPSYRWGWTNARRDIGGEPDGYEHIRFAYINLKRRQN